MSDLADGSTQPAGILITKRQLGAFCGTDVDCITTIVLGSMATVFGVESTTRQAREYGYDLKITEGATSSSAALQTFSSTEILPRIGIVVRAADILFTAD